MYVCVCHAVTEKQIAQAVAEGARRMRDLRARLGVAGSCGRCATCAHACLRQAGGTCPATGAPTIDGLALEAS